jgi:hypothetical protein
MGADRHLTGMTLSFFGIILAFHVQLLAQPSPGPEYYQTGHERVNSYVFRTYTDPARLGWLLVDAATDTWSRSPQEWDRSPECYSFRVASGWGRRIVRNTAQLAFEAMLHEDTRYRRSHEVGLHRRVLFALRRSVLSYKPDGKSQIAYGLIAAGVASAALSSTWHPQSTDADALLSGIGQAALDRAGGNLLAEFEPELKRFGRKTWHKVVRR